MKSVFQKSISLIFFMTAISSITTGCFLSSEKKPAAPAIQPPSGPAWQLAYSSACPAEVPGASPNDDSVSTNCIGFHGFKVLADKTFIIGPAPGGQIKTGTLTQSEFDSIETHLSQILTGQVAVSETGETCQDYTDPSNSGENGVSRAIDADDKLTLSFEKRDSLLGTWKTGRFCFHTANAALTENLHVAIRKLAEKYYLLPFPDRCAEAVDSAKMVFDAARACTKAEDCSYTNSNPAEGAIELISRNDSQYIVADNCSVLPPLVVVSSTALPTHQQKLQESAKKVAEVCAQNMIRPSCVGITGFESSKGAPVCDAGICRINPSITPAFSMH